MQNNKILFKILSIIPNVKTEFYQLQYGFYSTNFLIKNVLTIIKNHFTYCFKILSYISGIDYPKNLNRFKLVYDLLSLKFNNRIRIKIVVDEITPVRSMYSIFIGSVWWESEAWDMFGIIFSRQKVIVRLLTDYGFYGYPLRKDFPLSGFVESKYNLFKDKIAYDFLELAQSYRIFRQSSPWETKF